jgi:hypothetical protein
MPTGGRGTNHVSVDPETDLQYKSIILRTYVLCSPQPQSVFAIRNDFMVLEGKATDVMTAPQEYRNWA